MLSHDPMYGGLSPEEEDALFDHDALLAVRDRRADRSGVEVVPPRVRRRYRGDELAAQAALRPHTGNVENVVRKAA